jgi:FkbM family methyltransferase
MSYAAVAYTSLLLKGRDLFNRCLPDRALSLVPGGLEVCTSVRRFVSRHLIPSQSEWVQIQQGFANGLWIRIDLAKERAWWLGMHEPATQKTLRQVLGQDKVMYDIGAHLGFYALPAARLGAEVIAFEPDPESAARLRMHVERNGLGDRVRTVEAAVWSSSRPSITFRRGVPRSQGGVCWRDHQPVLATGGVIEVAAVSLDDFVASGEPAPQVIKLDVEGSEAEVLNGAASTLREYHPVLIVEVHAADQDAAVTEIIANAAYTAFWHTPPESFPRLCFAVPPKPLCDEPQNILNHDLKRSIGNVGNSC